MSKLFVVVDVLFAILSVLGIMVTAQFMDFRVIMWTINATIAIYMLVDEIKKGRKDDK
jgi:hypothetical protein